MSSSHNLPQNHPNPPLDAIVPTKHRSRRRGPPNLRKRLRKYEVFSSFRGEDTRASFTSHLHASLKNDGIKVFRDDHSLERGDRIYTSLLRAIEESRISVIVFCRNYADSRWCLDELVRIMHCRRTIGQVVLSVFYDVDPSEVSHQTGEFGKAFQNLLDIVSKEKDDSRNSEEKDQSLNSEYEDESVILELSWREALREAAGLAGFVILNSRNRLGMHDLVRDMGREIIREKSPKEPEERSRLWFNKDFLDVLSEQTGTKAVEGLALKLPRANAKCFRTKSFKKMKRLRLLQLTGVHLDGDFEYL